MRRILTAIAAALSALVLAAHLLRGGSLWLAVLVAGLPIVLAIRTGWATRAVQVTLVVGSIEWVRTVVTLVDQHRELGLPYTRMAVILGIVALFTALSALLLERWRSPLPRLPAMATAQ